MSLNGKVALITGGGSGVGQALAQRLAADGATVVITGRRMEPLEETAQVIREEGGEVRICQGDVSRLDDTRRMIAECVDGLGGLDILVNNAAINHCKLVCDIEEEDWDIQMGVNLKGPFFLSQAALPEMAKRGGGSIINVSSVSAQVPHPWTTVYCVTKAALTQLTRCLAQTGAKDNVRVNCVSPAVIDTPIHYTGQSEEAARAQHAERAKEYPLGRIGQPADVVGLIRFLVDDEAQWITGVDYVVDGGWTTLTGQRVL